MPNGDRPPPVCSNRDTADQEHQKGSYLPSFSRYWHCSSLLVLCIMPAVNWKFALKAGCTVPEVNRKVRCGIDAGKQQLLDDIHPARGCGRVQGAVLPAEVVLEEGWRAVFLAAQPCPLVRPSAYDHLASLSLAIRREGHLPGPSYRSMPHRGRAWWLLAQDGLHGAWPLGCCAPACWEEGMAAREKTAGFPTLQSQQAGRRRSLLCERVCAGQGSCQLVPLARG